MLLNDLTLNFDPFTISILKNEFKERNGEMDKNDFIMIIKDHFIHWQLDIPNRKKKLIRCLSLLFDDIDLNGNENMEWDEFTNYIIEKAAVLNTMKSKNEEIKSYQPCKMRVNMKFAHPIAKCIYIPIIDKIAFFEESCDWIHLANPYNGQIMEDKSFRVKIFKEKDKVDATGFPNPPAEKAMILDMVFVDDKKYNLLMVSSNDGGIRMFRWSSNGFVPADDQSQKDFKIRYDMAQVHITWDSVDEILYSGERDGTIRIWDQKKEPQYSILGEQRRDTGSGKDVISENSITPMNKMKRGAGRKGGKGGMRDLDLRAGGNKNKTRFKKSRKKKRDGHEGHTNVITCLLPLNKLQFLASASLDRKIILWDTIENKMKTEYKGYHKKGIMTLDFNENLILLISGGFDHEIYVWNPYIKAPVQNLSGHAAPIISARFIDNPLHIVTVDSDMTLKIWDAKKFKCSDTMKVEEFEAKKNFNPLGLCVLKKPLKLIIYGKNFSFLEYDRNNNLTSADENVSICAKFIPSNLTLLTPVGNKIKVWNLLTGEIKKIFSDITKSTISCVELDNRAKRFMVGDMDGYGGVYNVNNGALLKTLSRHKDEIIGLIHTESDTYNYIISASADNVIKIHDDRELADSDFLRQLTIPGFNITAVEFDHSKGKIIIGGNNGEVHLYEAATGKGNEEFKDKSNPDEEISCVVMIEGASCFIFSNNQGTLKSLAVPPLVVKPSKLCQYQNTDPDIPSKVMAVSTMSYCKEQHLLFVADEKYYIKCFSIEPLAKVCIEKLSNKEDKSRKDPKVPDDWISQIWCVRAHEDLIKSMEYVYTENLLFTTCVDRQVKILSSENGEFIEYLRQRKDVQRIKPIAYKKVESEEIYTPRMKHRIDTKYMMLFREKQQREKELQRRHDMGYLIDEDPEADFLRKLKEGEKKVDAFKEYEEQEFDPYYYFRDRIDQECINESKSNEWKLYLNFDRYYNEFEESTLKIANEIQENERQMLEENKLGAMSTRRSQHSQADIQMNQGELVKNVKKKLVSYGQKFKSETVIKEKKMLERMEKDKKLNQKKSRTKIHQRLYKGGLKKEMIKRMNHEGKRIKLSRSEIRAAERLAAALSKYDEDDPRSLMFTNFEERKERVKKETSSKKSDHRY